MMRNLQAAAGADPGPHPAGGRDPPSRLGPQSGDFPDQPKEGGESFQQTDSPEPAQDSQTSLGSKISENLPGGLRSVLVGGCGCATTRLPPSAVPKG